MATRLTAAIVTARFYTETSYSRWYDATREFLSRRRSDRYFQGEFGAIMAALMLGRERPCEKHFFSHVLYQLDALTLQSKPPDEVIVIDRTLSQDTSRYIAEILGSVDYPFIVRWTQPMLSGPEILNDLNHRLPGMIIQLNGIAYAGCRRERQLPYGNSDKNTAILLCQTDHLMMLDDCCFPGFACCEAVREICDSGSIAMLKHHKIYLQDNKLEQAVMNGSDQPPFVFGIWGMPLKYIVDVNGFNTDLDGQHALWDLELKARMDLYTQNRNIKYAFDDRATIYEIEHDRPWADGNKLESFDLKGWRAPGHSLTEARKHISIQEPPEEPEFIGYIDEVDE